MEKKILKYKGFSLVEMLLTIMILSIVMLLVATTLNTVIKASNTANSKNLARSDINYMMDIFNRSVSNAQLDDIYLYSSSSERVFTVASGLPEIYTDNPSNLDNIYETDLISNNDPTKFNGNEIHVKVYGYPVWTCLGYFRDVDDKYGYLVKTTNASLTDHSECFNSSAVITVLNSFSVDVKNFEIQYINVGDDKNSMFLINSTVTPLFWPVSDSFPVTRDVSRQIVISTEALTRY